MKIGTDIIITKEYNYVAGYNEIKLTKGLTGKIVDSTLYPAGFITEIYIDAYTTIKVPVLPSCFSSEDKNYTEPENCHVKNEELFEWIKDSTTHPINGFVPSEFVRRLMMDLLESRKIPKKNDP